MADSPAPLLRSVACPKCGERLAVRAEDMGKRGKCQRCEAVFVIGGAANAQTAVGAAATVAKVESGQQHAASSRPAMPGSPPVAVTAPPAPPTPRLPTTTTFGCELCQTRITVRVADVGKTVKCPDCGRKNVIPPPVEKPVVKTPAAMSGDQFDLWGVDEAPLPSELAARSPKLHPVVCEVCQTLMYATDAQVGRKLKCPDCGALTIARAREVVVRGPVVVPDGEEYQLDEASAPTPRPVFVPVTLRGREFDDEELAAQFDPDGKWAEREKRAAAKSRRGDRGGEDDGGGESDAGDRRPARSRLKEDDFVVPRDRPRLPHVPLVQGALRMVFTAELIARWMVLSVGVAVVGWFLSWVANAMSGSVFMAIPMFAIGCALGSVWLLSALPLCLAIVTESSEGNDRLHDSPDWMSFEFAEMFFVLVAAAVSAVPAGLTFKIPSGWPAEYQWALAAGVWMVCFPVVLLSNLEQSSAFAVFSPRLVASLVRRPGPWLLFYLESALLAAAAAAIGYTILQGPPRLAYALSAVLVGTLLVYMRLIGRLAWWLAETMFVSDEANE